MQEGGRTVSVQTVSQLKLPPVTYWPFWLVVGCGVILISVAILAAVIITIKEERHEEKKPEKLDMKQKTLQAGVVLGEPVVLQFVSIGRNLPRVTVQAFPELWMTAGSGPRADIKLNSDPNLKPIHFKICFSKGALLVKEAEGETYLQGIPIRQLGTVTMVSGDKLRAGSFEYRVTISPREESETLVV